MKLEILFTILPLALVAVIFQFMPLLTRRGIFFSATVDPEFPQSSDGRRLLRAQQEARVEQGSQASPTQVLEHEIGSAVLVAPVVDVQDVPVVERSGQSRFGLELAEKHRVAGKGWVKELDGDAPGQSRVIGGEDLGRGTGTGNGK